MLRFSWDIDFGPALGSARSFFKGIGGLANTFNETWMAASTLAQPFIDAGAAIGGGAIEAAAQMEGFEAQLTTLMGSSVEARKRMAELYQFAASTPFNVDQVVKAETVLRGFANTAAEDLMPRLMDFASALNTDVTQSAIDLGKAWSKGATGLESDTGMVLRKQIAQLNGWADDTKVPLDKFREGMLKAMDINYKDGALKAAQTFSGLMSTMQDEWSGFLREVGNADLFYNAKGALVEIKDLLDQNRTQVKWLAAEIAGGLWSAMKGFAYMVAYPVDIVAALAIGFGKVGLVIIDIERHMAALAQRVYGFFRGLYQGLGEILGLDENYNLGARFFGGLEDAAVSANVALRDSATSYQKSLDQFSEGTSAVYEVEKFFSAAETSAASFRAEAEKETGSGKKTFPEQVAEDAKEAEKWLKKVNAALEENQKRAEANQEQYAGTMSAMMGAEQEANQAILQRTQSREQAILTEVKARVAEQDRLLQEELRNGELTLGAQETLLQQHTQTVAAIHRDGADQIQRIRNDAAVEARNVVSQATEFELSEVERLALARQKAIDDYLTKAREAALTEQQIAADKATIIAAYNEQILQTQLQNTLDLTSKISGQFVSTVGSAMEDSYSASVDRIQGLTEQLAAGQAWYTTAQQAELQRRIEAEKKAALRSFEINKGLKMADAAVNTAAAITAAMDDAPWPANLALMGLAGAAGAAQIATIASEQPAIAHKGAFVEDLAPDETMIKATRNEVVLSPLAREQLGDDTILRAQAGQQARKNDKVLVVERYGHRAFNRFILDNIAQESPLSQRLGGAEPGARSF